MSNESQLDYKEGELNNSSSSRPRSTKINMYTDPVAFARHLQHLEPGSSKENYRGIVVRVENPSESTMSSIDNSAVAFFIENTTSEIDAHRPNASFPSDAFSAYKIFIPELWFGPHPGVCLSLEQLTDELYKIHEKIDRLPTFVSLNAALPKASEGDLVSVNFPDPNDKTSGFYLGLIHKNPNPISTAIKTTPSKAGKEMAKRKKKTAKSGTPIESVKKNMKDTARKKCKSKGE